MKRFFEHYSGIKAANDGEVLLPQSGVYPERRTYGFLKPDGHRGFYYKWKFYFIHRVMAEVFLNDNKPIPKGYVVHHINGNPEDNRVENLVILTQSEHRALHMTGRFVSEETRKKMSEYHKGRHLSDETRNKISEGGKGKHSKPIIGTHKTTGEIMEFAGAAEAEMVLGIAHQSISKCCKGKKKSAGGWMWQYA